MTEETYKKAIELFNAKKAAEILQIKAATESSNPNSVSIIFSSDKGNSCFEFGNNNQNSKLISDIKNLIIEHYGSLINDLNKKIEEL